MVRILFLSSPPPSTSARQSHGSWLLAPVTADEARTRDSRRVFVSQLETRVIYIIIIISPWLQECFDLFFGGGIWGND